MWLLWGIVNLFLYLCFVVGVVMNLNFDVFVWVVI